MACIRLKLVETLPAAALLDHKHLGHPSVCDPSLK